MRERTLRNLRNTRDLRAEILSLATELAALEGSDAQLIVINPVISEVTIRKEWQAAIAAIAADIRARMHLRVESTRQRAEPDAVPLGKTNYRHEVLRMLIEAQLRDEKLTVKDMVGLTEASQTPVRAALDGLRAAGVVQKNGAALHLRLEDITTALLAKLDALPKVLRFRFEQGARTKPAAELLQRCRPLLRESLDNDGWGRMALSGIATAVEDVPTLDIIGLPRLDLVAQIPHGITRFSTNLLRQLDDGLEHETNVLAPAPVAVTIVRAKLMRARLHDKTVQAPKSDIFLSLLNLDLREQALHYARAVRR